MRTCYICKQEKSLDEFYNNRSKPTGKKSECKDCDSQKAKERYIKKLQLITETKQKETMKLTEQKLEQLLSGLTQSEKKVYMLVPEMDHWTTSQIFAEAKRKGINMPISSIMGICMGLVKIGIVKKSGADGFCKERVERGIKDDIKSANENKKEFDVQKSVKKQIEQLRSMADHLYNQAAKAKDAADNLEIALVYMLEVEESSASKSLDQDKEFQAFLAFKAAIKS